MRRTWSSRNRWIAAAVLSVLLGGTASARAQTESGGLEQALQDVRERIRAGQHEAAVQAAQTARAALQAQADTDSAQIAQTYLLVGLAYVNYGNYQANERRPMAAETLYKEARAILQEGLALPVLHHLDIDPTTGEYPPEMVDLFERLRREMFGSLRIVALEPAGARAFLDGVPLRRMPGETVYGDTAVPAGLHTLRVECDGYRTQEEPITIEPSSRLERPYRLVKKRGRRFYALVGTGVAAAVTAIVTLGGGTSDAGAAAPLPGPPPPPAQ